MTTPYLHGVHAPVPRELTTGPLPVRGRLPEGLAGTFVRNSGNPFFPPKGRYHWFDGDGFVHGVDVRDGQVTYRSRWIATSGLQKEQAAGHALYDGLHDATGPLKDTANTDLLVWNRQLLATWWLTGRAMSLAVPSLETRGPATAGSTPLPRMAAHPKTDPRTGELVFMGYDTVRPPWVTYGVAHPDGRVHTAPIEVPHAHVPHDLGITERWSILLDLPLGWTTKGSGKRRLGFFKDRPSRFGLIPRWGSSADVRWFETDPCYVYHLVGCWEDGDTVVIVGCRIADPIPDVRTTDRVVARLDTIELVPYLYRWTLDTRTGAVKGEALDDVPTEFPRVDDRRWGRPVRTAFAPRVAAQEALTFDGLVRYDLATGARATLEWPAPFTSGEVVFAPRPGGTDDDDGWLVTVMSDGARSAFVVHDARTLAHEATVELPGHVAQGFHAEWVPAGAV
jgi:carotenoid cleavage dioxygenase-like enzyme